MGGWENWVVCVCETEFISFLLLSGLRRVSGHLSLEQSET